MRVTRGVTYPNPFSGHRDRRYSWIWLSGVRWCLCLHGSAWWPLLPAIKCLAQTGPTDHCSALVSPRGHLAYERVRYWQSGIDNIDCHRYISNIPTPQFRRIHMNDWERTAVVYTLKKIIKNISYFHIACVVTWKIDIYLH